LLSHFFRGTSNKIIILGLELCQNPHLFKDRSCLLLVSPEHLVFISLSLVSKHTPTRYHYVESYFLPATHSEWPCFFLTAAKCTTHACKSRGDAGVSVDTFFRDARLLLTGKPTRLSCVG
jgi:hypothetical protein